MARTHCYVATAPCGCISGAVVDDPDYPADTARAVAEFVRDGSTIARVALPFQMGGDCPHSPKWGRTPPVPATPASSPTTDGRR